MYQESDLDKQGNPERVPTQKKFIQVAEARTGYRGEV